MHHHNIVAQMDTLETTRNDNLSIIYDVCLLPMQQIENVFIVFSKSFSFFPQGTCALSVPSLYSFSMKLTTLFAFHSQKMWIHACLQYTKTNEWQTGVSPLQLLFSKKHTLNVPLAKQLYITCQGLKPHLSNWTYSNSFAITLKIPFGLNSSAYLYA